MERSELVDLLSPEGLRLLDSLPPWDNASDVVRLVSDLRKAGHPQGLVTAVLGQSRLRAKAVAKFGDFAGRMLFTEAGLEQATRLNVAALHAGRFAAAGLNRVADLGSGIGSDSMALAALDIQVTAVDTDEVTATVASYNLAPFDNAAVVHGDAETFDLTGFDAAWLDPARRTAGHSNTSRLTRPEDYSPNLDFVFGLSERMPIGVKLGPGHDRDAIPAAAEAQWVSVDGKLVEMGLWFGVLAREGIRRSALLLGRDGRHELTAAADSPDVETVPGEAGVPGSYLYEPDGAVIRARLIGDLARSMDALMLGEGIAYLSSESLHETPFATAFRVLESLPVDEKKLRLALKERRIGTLEIKKRGVDVDPAVLRTRLKLHGSESATLVLTRAGGHRLALLVERVQPPR
ncbi:MULTISPECIES: class I SAM-dependent methyltransferase [Cryobacterium]|uniref:Class I SAM-dependent methyltransferase n=1 Tax=Cryobacterium glucosi TaxID=1259175 RepID=A0ABY2IME3_9MICO|nr:MULTISPECIES: class I SAM-dependent methyltransferase [Cryobacterium]MDY7529060.1 class I SAM-dependent methyltransferase [Cryobacterium sp. 10C2]MDY7558771.1 class I SAM-dependent methyltransferase [Cryobacterium sp. 10C3]MEB0202795.1 class I SAM-dependent methyltransferase [Cryobacterium sp. 5I3]MEB0291053.1 class I SAM-dependent methyltransferase [Cryobacterium sp. 10C2]TFC20509.1 class I SAM-dependent methyltransferase [Cryobacterium glucosi]